MSDIENGYCALNGHGLYGGKDRDCPWCRIEELKAEIMALSDSAAMTDMKYDALVEGLREPTEEMLVAARDWSYEKYGKPIGNDAAKGCLKAMVDALLGDEA